MSFLYPKPKLRLGGQYALTPGALSPRGANTVGCNDDSLRECDRTLVQLAGARQVRVEAGDAPGVVMDLLEFCAVAGHCAGEHPDWALRQRTFQAVLPRVVGALGAAARTLALSRLERSGYASELPRVLEWFEHYPPAAHAARASHLPELPPRAVAAGGSAYGAAAPALALV